jgi:hypothetical protein
MSLHVGRGLTVTTGITHVGAFVRRLSVPAVRDHVLAAKLPDHRSASAVVLRVPRIDEVLAAFHRRQVRMAWGHLDHDTVTRLVFEEATSLTHSEAEAAMRWLRSAMAPFISDVRIEGDPATLTGKGVGGEGHPLVRAGALGGTEIAVIVHDEPGVPCDRVVRLADRQRAGDAGHHVRDRHAERWPS